MRSDDVLSGLPRLRLAVEGADELTVLRRLQALVLAHPVAAQVAFAALVAEGRRVAQTPDGRRVADRLTRSPLLRRLRLAWDVGTLWMLEEHPGADLPSRFVDALFMLAQRSDLEVLVEELTQPPPRGADAPA